MIDDGNTFDDLQKICTRECWKPINYRTYSRWRRDNFVKLFGIDETESITVKLTGMDISETQRICFEEPAMVAASLPKKRYDDYSSSSSSDSSVPMLEGDESDASSIVDEEIETPGAKKLGSLQRNKFQEKGNFVMPDLSMDDDDIMISRFGADDHLDYSDKLKEDIEAQKLIDDAEMKREKEKRKVNLPKPKSEIKFL